MKASRKASQLDLRSAGTAIPSPEVWNGCVKSMIDSRDAVTVRAATETSSDPSCRPEINPSRLTSRNS